MLPPMLPSKRTVPMLPPLNVFHTASRPHASTLPSLKNRSFARLNATAPPRGSMSWGLHVCMIKRNLLLCQIKCNH
jgi:hypothetical protein